MPSLTEMAFFLGQGDKLVGVTPYCLYPNEAKKISKIGSAVMLDYEKVLKLGANLVMLPDMKNRKSHEDLEKLKIPYIVIGHERLVDIIKGIYDLNLKLKANQENLVKDFENFFITEKNNPKAKDFKAKKVLLVISEEVHSGNIRSVRVASRNTIYGDLLDILGHQNVINHSSPYPVLTLEDLLKLEYDKVIRIGPAETFDIRNNWLKSNFKKKMSFILKDYAVVTGPRLRLLLSDLKEALK